MSLFNQQNPNPKSDKYGLLAGILEALYIYLFILFTNNVSKIFQTPKDKDILVPLFMLIAFVFSAAVSGLLVLGYPGYLFLIKKETKPALTTLAITLLTLLIIGIAVFLSMFIS